MFGLKKKQGVKTNQFTVAMPEWEDEQHKLGQEIIKYLAKKTESYNSELDLDKVTIFTETLKENPIARHQQEFERTICHIENLIKEKAYALLATRYGDEKTYEKKI